MLGLLFELLFREIFEFRCVQTDPNFANYATTRRAAGWSCSISARRGILRAALKPTAACCGPGSRAISMACRRRPSKSAISG